MAVNGIALTAVTAGAIFTWSGIKGWSVLGTLTDIVSGKPPASDTKLTAQTLALTNPEAASGLGGAGIGQGGIAGDAVSYIGHRYLFGGAPGRDGSKPWDCSSFVNWVVGHDAKMAIPGMGPGKYDGTVHGPPTGMWGIWPGLRRISRGNVQAGDIIVWTGHMGIAIANNRMVSATGPNGTPSTIESPIDGHGNGPLLKYGRLA